MPAKRSELIVIAGPNGSGKTSITEQLLKHTWTGNCVYINPDDIALREFGGWNTPGAFLKAAREAERRREACLEDRASLAFETVFSAPEKLVFLSRARAANFFIRLFFVCTDDPWINVARVAQRVQEGGHDVPRDKIISRYSKSIANCASAARFVDRAYVFDNSVDDRDPALLFRTVDGSLKKLYRNPASNWAKPILDSLE